jgi:hypothetical protein
MMRFSKPIPLLSVIAALSCAVSAQNILPTTFAGWTQTGDVQVTTQPAQANSAYPEALSEYGFAKAETARYTRADGRKLTVNATQFKDATGAYGAFTFYRDPAMKSERIGTKAASANEHILFFRSNVLVDTAFDRVTGMSAAELRELAGMLPEAKSSAANLPNLPEYLPKENAQDNSAKYILGPQALAASKTPLPAELVGFNFDPEILTQSYATGDGPVMLMLVEYPTPQIATERLRAFEAFGNGLVARRTGPILVLESGNVGSSEARKLLNAVNYEAEVTWNEATSISKRDNIGNLLIAVFSLIGILLLFGLVFGIFMGGIRVVVSKYFPGTVLDVPENVEILQLHLSDRPTADK